MWILNFCCTPGSKRNAQVSQRRIPDLQNQIGKWWSRLHQYQRRVLPNNDQRPPHSPDMPSVKHTTTETQSKCLTKRWQRRGYNYKVQSMKLNLSCRWLPGTTVYFMENLLDSGWERPGQSQCVGNDHTRVKKGGEDQPRSCGPPPMQLQLGPPCSKLELNHLHLLSICIFHPDCPIVITLTISPPTILQILKNKMQSSVHVILTTLSPFCEAFNR